MSATYVDQDIEVSNPEKLHHNWGRFSRGDKQFVAIWLSISAVIAWVIIATWTFWFTVPFLVLMIHRRTNGRNYFLLGRWSKTRYIRDVLDGEYWSPEPAKPLRAAVLSRGSPFPLEINTIDGNVLVHNLRNRTDGIVVVGDGSDITSRNPRGQHNAQRAFADTMKKAASVYGLKIGCSCVFMKRPTDRFALAAMLSQNLNPEVLLPEALLKEEEDWTDEDYRLMRLNAISHEMQAKTAEKGRKVTMATVWTIKRQLALTSSAKGKSLAEDDANRLPINDVRDTVIAGLQRTGIVNPRELNLQEVITYLREARDLKHIDEYREDLARGTFDDIESSDLMPHLPEHGIIARYGHCEIDGTAISTIRITDSPSSTLPYFFNQLYAANVPWFTLALVGETIQSNGEYLLLDKAIPILEGFEDRAGIEYKGPRAQKKEQARKDRQQEIYLSNFAQDYSILMTLSQPLRDDPKGKAADLKTHEDHVKRVLLMVDSISEMAASRITGESFVVDAALTGITGFNML